MAKVLTETEIEDLQKTESQSLESKQAEFKEAGKDFVVPDEHWSGVMPEDYRANLPGKKEER